jgi:hypothetical protein
VGVARREDNDLYYWEEMPKEKTLEGPNGCGNPNDGCDPSDVDTFGMHLLCYTACCHSISELYASVDECFQAMEAMRQCTEDLERVVEDDYKFLNQNMRKLFGMVANVRSKWCKNCGMFHKGIEFPPLGFL